MSDQVEGDLFLNQLSILTSKESKTENTQYFVQSWPDRRPVQITNFPHPYPQLASLHKEMIKYQRSDGVQLTATLYLPPGYDSSKDGPLPCLVWSYPGEFKSKDAAGQVRGSPNEFASIGPTSPLLWLARRSVSSSLRLCTFTCNTVVKLLYLQFSIILTEYTESCLSTGLLFYQDLPFLSLARVMKKLMTGKHACTVTLSCLFSNYNVIPCLSDRYKYRHWKISLYRSIPLAYF